MSKQEDAIARLLTNLRERAKELNCLYAVEEILNTPDAETGDVCRGIVRVIPPGWQYPDLCRVRVEHHGEVFESDDFHRTEWSQKADLKVQDRRIGEIAVFYTEETPHESDGPFLKEETRLIRTIADRVSHYLLYERMKRHFDDLDRAGRHLGEPKRGDWRVVMQLLDHTDPSLFAKISHQMLNHLSWTGVKAAEDLLESADLYYKAQDDQVHVDTNLPIPKRRYSFPPELSRQTFLLAEQHLSDDDILARIQKWMQEDKLAFLVRAVEKNLPVPEVVDALRRYHHLAVNEAQLSAPMRAAVRVSLIRRFLSDQLSFIRVAKEYIGIDAFHEILETVIYSSDQQGRLGGKSAGMYLAANILERERDRNPEIGTFKIPKTWHVTADMQVQFMHFNSLDDIVEQKYKSIGQVRRELRHIVHTFKNSRFPPDLVKGLSVALDDFGGSPLVVRSSSVLEDRVGAAFSGKYKSLFLANQGKKQERLDALLDAIAEIYASTFGPDPIEYRAERGLLDFAEEMGIMIQEVVGVRVGPYHFPPFSGVAFSRNEFRWSPRIRREDGLLRLVPGLGTRAVDRLADDYPIMFAPGQPGLRVNQTPEEILRYSPRWMDVIDIEENTFKTVDAAALFAQHADRIPLLPKLVSVLEGRRFRRPTLADVDLRVDRIAVTCEGLMADRPFVRQMATILRVLEERIGDPVDVEFAHDGKNLYILQCRTQSPGDDSLPAPIPRDLDPERVVFSAHKYVSNGHVPDITHIVYVDPARYATLSDVESLRAVGKVVGQLNELLPKRQFILMGPGRWGSRGDIKLGVSVTYADINNTAVLIEIARQKDNYTPDLSFGTHFFQDLVEARIRYLPLYPDDAQNIFDEHFLTTAPNVLPKILPEFQSLGDTVRVIDVPQATDGLVLRVLLNSELDTAIGLLSPPSTVDGAAASETAVLPVDSPAHWQWRQRVVEQIAKGLDAERYGVKAFYLFGSTKNCTAGPASDIDLLVHITSTPAQREALSSWFEGWSASLDEVNFTRTGYRTGGILDVHFVTDEDIANRTSYAVKIGAVTDAAREVPLPVADPDSDEVADG